MTYCIMEYLDEYSGHVCRIIGPFKTIEEAEVYMRFKSIRWADIEQLIAPLPSPGK